MHYGQIEAMAKQYENRTSCAEIGGSEAFSDHLRTAVGAKYAIDNAIVAGLAPGLVSRKGTGRE